MSKQIVVIHNNEGRAGTVLIAEGFNRRHEQVIRLVKKYQDKFESLNTLKVFMVRTKGRSFNVFLLDEDQFMFLGTLFKNIDQTVKFKHELIKAFKKCRKQLERALNQDKKDPAYNQARLTNKTLRMLETGAIQEFIAYAKNQGGTAQGCDFYYRNFTNMVNGLLFVCEGKFKNIRDILTPEQLMIVGAAEQIIGKSLRDAMKANIFYKDIYRDIKRKIKIFAELHGQSEVLNQCLLIEEE